MTHPHAAAARVAAADARASARLAAALTALLFVIALALVPRAPAYERGLTAQGKPFVTGGVSREEQADLEAMQKSFTLWLTTADERSGAYLSDAAVEIRDAQNALILTTTMNGPFLLADLEPGRYRVLVTLGGQTRAVTADVARGVVRRVVVRFPAGADVLPDPRERLSNKTALAAGLRSSHAGRARGPGSGARGLLPACPCAAANRPSSRRLGCARITNKARTAVRVEPMQSLFLPPARGELPPSALPLMLVHPLGRSALAPVPVSTVRATSASDHASALHNCLDRPVVGGNLIELLIDEAQTEAAIFAAVRAARDHVHLECRRLDARGAGAELADLLVARRAAGVSVSVMLDGDATGADEPLPARLRNAGVALCRFNPGRQLGAPGAACVAPARPSQADRDRRPHRLRRRCRRRAGRSARRGARHAPAHRRAGRRPSAGNVRRPVGARDRTAALAGASFSRPAQRRHAAGRRGGVRRRQRPQPVRARPARGRRTGARPRVHHYCALRAAARAPRRAVCRLQTRRRRAPAAAG